MQSLNEKAVNGPTGAPLRASFESASLGMLILDADGFLLEHNAAADRLLGEKAVLACARYGKQQRLVFSDLATEQLFHAAISRLIGGSSLQPETLLLASPGYSDSADRAALHLCAYSQRGSDPLGGAVHVLGFLCDLSIAKANSFHSSALQTAFQLTVTEARVALALHLYCDCNLAAVALNLRISTVRSHLKAIFRKLCITRQGELLLLIERVLAGVPNVPRWPIAGRRSIGSNQ